MLSDSAHELLNSSHDIDDSDTDRTRLLDNKNNAPASAVNLESMELAAPSAGDTKPTCRTRCPVFVGRLCGFLGLCSIITSATLYAVRVCVPPRSYNPRASALDVAAIDCLRSLLIVLFCAVSKTKQALFTAQLGIVLAVSKLWAFNNWGHTHTAGDSIIVVMTTTVAGAQLVLCVLVNVFQCTEELKMKYVWRVVRPYFWPTGTKHRLVSLAMWTTLLAAKGCAILAPLELARIIDLISQSPSPPNSTIVSAITIYAALMLAPKLLGEGRDVLYTHLWHAAYGEGSLTIFRHLHSLPYEWHMNKKLGALVESVNDGIAAADNLVYNLFVLLIPAVWSAVAAFVIFVVHLQQPVIAAVCFAGVGVYLWATLVLTAMRQAERDEVSEAVGNVRAFSADALVNFESIKIFNRERYMEKRFEKAVDKHRDAYLKARHSHSHIDLAQSTATIVTNYVALLLAGLAITAGFDNDRMTVANFVALNAYIAAIFEPLTELARIYMQIVNSLIDLKDITKVLSVETEPSDSRDAVDLAAFEKAKRVCRTLTFTTFDAETGEEGHRTEEVCFMDARGVDVEFKNVSFRYPTQRYNSLSDVSFFVPACTTTAIVGETGSGKSSIARLLLRLYDPDRGAVFVGGHNVKKVTRSSLRGAIGVVPQDTSLFNDSLERNIQFGRPEACKEEYESALKRVQLDRLADTLPADAPLGERGQKLSGGERQRVALARCLLKHPSVLVLDEATSALDAKTERQVQMAMESFAGEGRTAIIIAHRLATIKYADQILVLRSGRISERGTHTELLEKPNSFYRALWMQQEHEARAGQS